MTEDNVYNMMPEPQSNRSSSGGGGGGFDKVDERLRTVEDKLTRLATLMENVATKEDLEKMKSNIHQFVAYTIIGIVGITIAIVQLL